jgi:hypothetical protein
MTATLTHEQLAREYLNREFGTDAPDQLRPIATYNQRPLEGEGAVSVFSFTAARGGNSPESFYVIAGETEPNYYPDWGLSPEDLYNVHLGTRFMLVLDVTQLPLEELAPSLESEIALLLAGVAPGEPIAEFRPVAAFCMEGQRHAVCRLRLADEELYVLGGDLPLGIYRRIDLPPRVVYRLHLGKVIRMEEEEEEE